MPNPSYLTEADAANERRHQSQAQFEQAVRQAHADGWTMRQIASAVGLSASRVFQIVNSEKGREEK